MVQVYSQAQHRWIPIDTNSMQFPNTVTSDPIKITVPPTS